MPSISEGNRRCNDLKFRQNNLKSDYAGFLLLRFEQEQTEKSFDSLSLDVLRTGETDNLQG